MKLLVSKSHRVLHVTLNRPEKRNALDAEMAAAITNAIAEAQEDDQIGCILIAAKGPVFCSGMDLDEAADTDHTRLSAVHEALFTIGSQSLKPVLVAVNGTALGGGLGLVAQGHVVLAGEGVTFRLPEIRVGLWPFLVYRSVEAALGSRRTLELSLTGHPFSADQGYAWGLVHRVCPPLELIDRARAMARELAKGSPLAMSLGMQYVRDSRGKSWKEAGDLSAALRAKLMESADFQEGRVAFKQRREPHWPSMPSDFYSAKPTGT